MRSRCRLMGKINLIVLTVYTGLVNLYLYELFLGGWPTAYAKGLFYFSTSLFLLYLIIGELIGYYSKCELQSNIVGKCILFCNFFTFALAQLNLMPKPVMYILLLNGSFFVVSFTILYIFGKHELFND